MSAFERVRMLESKSGRKAGKEIEKQALNEWDGEQKTADWEHLQIPAGGFAKPYSTLTKRFGQVRTSDWGLSSGKRKASSLRKEELL